MEHGKEWRKQDKAGESIKTTVSHEVPPPSHPIESSGLSIIPQSLSPSLSKGAGLLQLGTSHWLQVALRGYNLLGTFRSGSLEVRQL